MAVIPRKAHLSGTVNWSDGTPFDGYCALGLALPNDSMGVPYLTVALAGVYPVQRIPIWAMVAITSGVFDPNTSVFYSDDLEPRNCKYVAYWFDSTGAQVFPVAPTPPALFSINSDPFPISIPTLTVPVVTTNAPVPQY